MTKLYVRNNLTTHKRIVPNINNITEIGDSAFYELFAYQDNVYFVDLPLLSKVESNGMCRSYMLCSNLTAINLDSLTSIGKSGLNCCFNNTKVTKVRFPELVTVDSNGMYYCFQGCNKLEHLYFNKLSSIGSDAFLNMVGGCTNLVAVHFPSGMSTSEELTAAKLGCDASKILFDL